MNASESFNDIINRLEQTDEWTDMDITLARAAFMSAYASKLVEFGKQCVRATSTRTRDLPALKDATETLHRMFSDVVELMLTGNRDADEESHLADDLAKSARELMHLNSAINLEHDLAKYDERRAKETT